MGNLLCRVGRHSWLRRQDRVAQANGGVHQVCARCGKERLSFKDPPPSGILHYGGTGAG